MISRHSGLNRSLVLIYGKDKSRDPRAWLKMYGDDPGFLAAWKEGKCLSLMWPNYLTGLSSLQQQDNHSWVENARVEGETWQNVGL